MVTQRTEQVDCGDAGQMDMHVWSPGGDATAAVLVIQEIFGVGPYIRAVAERLVAAGYVVGAPDVFWRFERNWQSDHSESGLAASMAKVQQLDFAAAVGDCCSALGHLDDLTAATAKPAVLGFCLGGTLAWGVAAAVYPSVCVSYYGSGVPDMIDLIDEVSCPTLLHFGNADAFIPNEGVERIGAAIAGRDNFVLNVENAGHAFDNHESSMFYDKSAAEAAWAKTMAFLTSNHPATV